MKKNIFILLTLAFLGLGGVLATAQTGWIGTSWIGSGNTVSSENLKSNLDYLYNNKAPKPADCVGDDQFLGWVNGGWTCVEKDQPDSCIFNGNTISNGDVVTAYAAGTVSFGETCQSQRRTCTNGVLSGTYQSASCQVTAASACAFNDTSVPNGTTVTAYESENVAFGEACQSEVRSCTNGTLSGSFTAGSCSVTPASTCVFDGQILQDGDTVDAWNVSNEAEGESCTVETRTCTDGTLSGSFTNNSCTPSPEPIVINNLGLECPAIGQSVGPDGANRPRGDRKNCETPRYNVCQADPRLAADGKEFFIKASSAFSSGQRICRYIDRARRTQTVQVPSSEQCPPADSILGESRGSLDSNTVQPGALSDWANRNTQVNKEFSFKSGARSSEKISSGGDKRNELTAVYDGACTVYVDSTYRGGTSEYKRAYATIEGFRSTGLSAPEESVCTGLFCGFNLNLGTMSIQF